jgi:hypothetical protein
VDAVASQAGSVRALGDDPGLRGGAIVESRYTDATLMTEAQLRGRTSENSVMKLSEKGF